MSEYYNVVPWYNSDEWRLVYDKIYSETATLIQKEEGLSILMIWKARCPSLPSGIESTLILLEVYVQDLKCSDSTLTDQVLRLAYSSAVMRFVNHTLDHETAKGSSLYRAAQNLGVPDWIIDLRHETAHSNKLPSIQLLRDATVFGLSWLKLQYWDKFKAVINDYMSGQVIKKVDDSKIAALIHFCISLGVCSHSKCQIKKLSDIPDVHLRESIVDDARELFGQTLDFSNDKNVSISKLKNIVDIQSKKILNSVDAAPHINKAMLDENSLFMSIELVQQLGNSKYITKHKLGKNYVQCFEILLRVLHTNDLILYFLLDLIKFTQISDSNGKCVLAALWVSEILRALKRSKLFATSVKRLGSENLSHKNTQDLKLMFYHWYPSYERNELILDLLKPVPKDLSNINFLHPIISSYNSYLTYFIQDLLALVEPQLPYSATKRICELAEVISSPNKFPITSERIFTVDDLMINEKSKFPTEDDNDSDICMVSLEEKADEIRKEQVTSLEIWKLDVDHNNWDSTPIGQFLTSLDSMTMET